MEKLTQKGEDNGFYIADEAKIIKNDVGYTGDAVKKLALYENMHSYVLSNQESISEELLRLKMAGKEKSARFKELMGQKLTNTAMLNLFELFDLM